MLLYGDPTELIGDLVMDRIGLGTVAWEVNISSIFHITGMEGGLAPGTTERELSV